MQAVRSGVEAWLADHDDFDIADDLRYVDRFVENLQARGAALPPPNANPPPEPGPADSSGRKFQHDGPSCRGGQTWSLRCVMRLVSIAFSHYNERARWALDRFEVPYHDSRCLPGFHVPAVLWATRGRRGQADRISSALSTPLLVTDAGERIHDSGAIVRWADARYGDPSTTLYPVEHRDRILEIEQRLHDEVGPHTRRVAYGFVFGHPGLLRDLVDHNVGRAQAAAFRSVAWAAVPRMKKGLGLTPDKLAHATERSVTASQTWSEVLRGRTYLVGGRFTAADLALACMFAPVVLPTRAEGYSAWMPALSELPPDARALSERMRDTEVGRHTLRMFAQERRAPAA